MTIKQNLSYYHCHNWSGGKDLWWLSPGGVSLRLSLILLPVQEETTKIKWFATTILGKHKEKNERNCKLSQQKWAPDLNELAHKYLPTRRTSLADMPVNTIPILSDVLEARKDVRVEK